MIDRELKQYDKQRDWTQKARFLKGLNRNRDALIEYLKGIQQSLDQGNNFSAAFYLRELVEEDLITELYLTAYKDAETENDLWWQVRVLQDLGWEEELKDLLLGHAQEIRKSENMLLLQQLAWAEGDTRAADNLIKEEAKNTTTKYNLMVAKLKETKKE